MIDSFTCILIYAIGRELFGRKVGTVAALISALYPAFIYYSTVLFQETTTIFLLTLYTFLLCRAISQKKPLLYFISGMLITVISFYRSGFLLLLFIHHPPTLLHPMVLLQKRVLPLFSPFLHRSTLYDHSLWSIHLQGERFFHL